ncbi:hypothetical protein J3R30DRAFT_168738 [Lentinula aciculospora]|uniref:Uncharacterized protein n=1 Tax=Lentinula aciculospora TaxID=153920 RepID=A0A9W9DXM4_9AGAR|nr:hypothetical protein J3R30DRAFT_168738 [Lentinula aciculospora]
MHMRGLPSDSNRFTKMKTERSLRARQDGRSVFGSIVGRPSAYVVPSSYSRPELVRSVSSSSLRSTSATNHPDMSAKYNIRDTRTTIDFSIPPTTDLAHNHTTTTLGVSAEASLPTSLPLTCSSKSVIYFTCGNRVHFKNMQTNEDISLAL